MARTKVKLPDLGDSADGAVVVEWQVGVGDVVEPEQALMIVETDKVDTEVPAPLGGTVVELLVSPGDQLQAGDPLCVIES
jgi:pyruvate/2-oxoglutarate dehydrogenase complex dihydrolipoamide acyltransferase (E2) component